jgi:hypothetical protein
MSGEVVVVPAVPLVLVALPLVALGMAVNAQFEEHRVAAAKREKERLAIWQAHAARQSEAMRRLNEDWQTMDGLRQRLADIQLVEPPVPSGEIEGGRNVSEPHDAAVPEKDQIRSLLVSVDDLLAGLPQSMREHHRSPFPKLGQLAIEWLERLNRRAVPNPAELEAALSFRETVARTVSTWCQDLKQEEEGVRRLLERSERLLDELLYCMQQEGGGDDEVRKLWTRLNTLLQDEEITPGTLAWMEQRVAALTQKSHERLDQDGMRRALQTRLRHHVGELGYEMIEEFSSAGESGLSRGVLQIPGGECVEVTVFSDGKMAFAMRHQRSTKTLLPMSREQKDHFRAQEAIWCRDLKSLVRRLVDEGWPFKIPFDFERKIPDGAIAVLETPDDWESENGSENDEDRRVFHKKPLHRSLP